jgi:CMP-N-acetylneuraminic acid synthetase
MGAEGGCVINGQSVMAVIPARGGSKRVPDKNLKIYRGKPIVHWAIFAARGSKYIDHFCVSSDSDDILKLAKQEHANAIKRPDWLATDHAMNEGVLVHILYTWKWADWVVLLQPTSPLRHSKDIDECLERAQMGRGCVTYNEYGKRNGAVFVARTTDLISRIEFSRDTLDQFLIMPNDRSLDIDYAVDLDS